MSIGAIDAPNESIPPQDSQPLIFLLKLAAKLDAISGRDSGRQKTTAAMVLCWVSTLPSNGKAANT